MADNLGLDLNDPNDKARLEKALKMTWGNLTNAAEEAGICRRTLYNYRQEHPWIDKLAADLKREHREHLLELAETKLWQQLQAGEWHAVKFTLERIAESSFIPKQHNENKVTADVTVNNLPDLPDDTLDALFNDDD